MAKDPAFLFYTSDFLTGTITLTDEQVGKYIRLLCLQHQKGILSEKDMLFICKTYDEDIFSKFVKSDEGYFNKRLRDESEKRARYSLSRSNNRLRKNISSSYVNHMENENENIEKGVIGGKTIDYKSFEKQKFYSFDDLIKSNHWERLREFIYQKTYLNPKTDKHFIHEVAKKYDGYLLEKELWLTGYTAQQFAGGLIKWILNEKKFEK